MDAKMYKAYVNKVYSAVENMAKSFQKKFQHDQSLAYISERSYAYLFPRVLAT